MRFNENQTQAINSDKNTVVIGAPGTGKTMVIIAKIKKLLASGVSPELIAIVCFSPKSAYLFKIQLVKYLGNEAKRIKFGTFKDYAETELRATNSLEGDFADNTQIRRLLHQAKQATNFAGSIHEAEHIIRNFKSQAKKPQPTDDNFDIFSKYQDLIHNRNWYDRYDCLRQHLISLRNDMAHPCRVKHMFIDNAQDMNQIQLLWTLEHAIAGINVNLYIDDDQCIFNRSGAVGGKVIDTAVESEARFEKIMLNKSYRLTKNLQQDAYKIVSLADQRYTKPDLECLESESSVEIKEFNSRTQEVDSIVANIKKYFSTHPNTKVAVITRSDEDARFISNCFKHERLPFTDFSRDIWEMPGSIVVIDMLEVIMGTANSARLKNVLSSLGLSSRTIDEMFSKGLTGEGWVQTGAKVDKALISDEDQKKRVTQIQSLLTSYYNVRTELPIKEIFKALCFELMKVMSNEDKKDALYAIESVLNFKGDIRKNIDEIRADKNPDPNSRLIVGPVREFRNFEFDIVFMPFCQANIYPYDYKVLGKKNSSDRRIFFTAMTRSKGTVYLSYTGAPSTYIKALQR